MIISRIELDKLTIDEIRAYEFDVLLKRHAANYVESGLLGRVAAVLPPPNNMGATPPLTPLFLPQCEISGEIIVQKTMIDWLGFSACVPLEAVVVGLQCLWPDIKIVGAGCGMRGYPQCKALEVGGVQFGLVGYGASKHSRVSVSLTGVACKTIMTNEQFAMVHELMVVLDARLSRLDICLDVYRKELTFEAALWAFDDGQFKKPNAPQNPMQRLLGEKGGRGENLGRTMYIGPRDGELYGRVYEKGMQIFAKMPEEYREQCTERENSMLAEFEQGLGTIADDWLRLEAEFKRKHKDRPIPLEAILQRDIYFAGAYPFFASALQMWTGKGRASMKENSVICHDKLIAAHKRSYGNHMHTLHEIGYTKDEIFDLLTTGLHNQKLLKSGLFALERDILAAEMSKIQDSDIPF